MSPSNDREFIEGPTYPPAPWELHGWGAQSLLLMERKLATVYFASYDSGTLRYRELIVARGLRWIEGLPRFHIERIWVDSAQSVAGGRAIWHLPKELAAFEFSPVENGTHVAVRDAGGALCEMEITAGRGGIPIRLPVPSFGTAGGIIHPFTANVSASTALARVRVHFSENGPFAAFNNAKTLAAWRFRRLSLRVAAPS